MNVGSILNNDGPVDAGSVTANSSALNLPVARPGASARPERHSIVNLLNDDEKSAKNKNILNKKDAEKKQHETSSGSLGGQEFNGDISTQKSIKNDEIQRAQNAPVDELARLHKLKSLTKPTRYTVPPIWAQEWNPSKSGAPEPIIQGPPDISGTYLSSKRVFDPTITTSVDLECSITGVIPPASVTRTVAEWVYANFTEIPNDQRQNVELEAKFGLIVDKRSGRRIDISVASECIFTDKANTHFDMGVHEVGWRAMCDFLDELERKYQEENRKSNTKTKHKFSRLESDVTDRFYEISERNSQPKTMRVSTDALLKRQWGINKQRLSDLYIHNPLCMHDLRLSLLYEHPIPETSLESIVSKHQPVLTRAKKRTSWSHRPTVTTFDLTKVQTPRELKNMKGKKIVDQDTSFEVELEVDTPELFSGYDLFKTGADTIRFEELIEIFLNNARCLNNRVTKMANK